MSCVAKFKKARNPIVILALPQYQRQWSLCRIHDSSNPILFAIDDQILKQSKEMYKPGTKHTTVTVSVDSPLETLIGMLF